VAHWNLDLTRYGLDVSGLIIGLADGTCGLFLLLIPAIWRGRFVLGMGLAHFRRRTIYSMLAVLVAQR